MVAADIRLGGKCFPSNRISRLKSRLLLPPSYIPAKNLIQNVLTIPVREFLLSYVPMSSWFCSSCLSIYVHTINLVKAGVSTYPHNPSAEHDT